MGDTQKTLEQLGFKNVPINCETKIKYQLETLSRRVVITFDLAAGLYLVSGSGNNYQLTDEEQIVADDKLETMLKARGEQ